MHHGHHLNVFPPNRSEGLIKQGVAVVGLLLRSRTIFLRMVFVVSSLHSLSVSLSVDCASVLLLILCSEFDLFSLCYRGCACRAKLLRALLMSLVWSGGQILCLSHLSCSRSREGPWLQNRRNWHQHSAVGCRGCRPACVSLGPLEFKSRGVRPWIHPCTFVVLR